MKLPEFKTKKELFAFLVENKETIIAQKKAEMKRADAVSVQPVYESDTIEVNKSDQPDNENHTEIKVKAVINTTNLMDSHDDVHLPGIWSKSLKENKRVLHLQEHQMAFDKIIADKKDLKPYTQKFKWSELGFKYEGETEALVFDSNIKAKRNPFMFEQYKEGNVDNHSVGMYYVKVDMAVNDPDFKDEYRTWNKYYSEIANKEQADAKGYFFAVKEAKVIEGSAVPLGSNWATPTLDSDKSEPLQDTPDNEPVKTTQEKTLSELIKEIKFFN